MAIVHSPLPTAAFDEIQRGWKVYASTSEIGRVEDIADDELVIRRGRLIRHTYRVPADYVDSAVDGIVDLTLDRDQVERLESGH